VELGDSADDEVCEGVLAGGGEGLAEDGAHAEAMSADDVGFDEVADEDGLGGGHAEGAEREVEDAWVGLAVADLAGIDAYGEEFEQAVEFHVLIEDEAWDEGIGDEGELEAAVAELGERGDDVGRDGAVLGDGGIPLPGELTEGGVVKGEVHPSAHSDEEVEAVELAATDLGAQIGPVDGEVLGPIIPTEGGEHVAASLEVGIGAPAGLFEDGAGVHRLEVKEGIAEIEEDGLKHDWLATR